MKQVPKVLFHFVFVFFYLMMATAQQLRPELGEEKAAAVDAMLKSAFPGTTVVWDVNLSVRSADGTSTRLALTSIVKVPGAPQPEFIAGIQEYDGSGRDLSRLRMGETISGVPQKLVAVTKNGNGTFQVVSSVVLEPNHALTIINRLSSDPLGSSRVLVSYKTVDLYQYQVVETSWYVAMDAKLNVLLKQPSGVEVKGIAPDTRSKAIYITPSATGVVATNHQTGKTTDITCPAICDLTVQQLMAIN